MKRAVMMIFLALTLGLALLNPAMAQSGVMWTGEYFNNKDLSGSPVFVLSESTPSHNWGNGSPSPAIPLDYFSARWTSVQVLTGGTYQITVRADDGVRVYVNEVLTINQWQPSPGNAYAATFTVGAGSHRFVVEYFEETGSAYLQYAMTGGGAPPPPASAAATVTTNQLNVRHIPNPYTGTVLARIRLGEVYPIVGRNADSSWVQLNTNGTIGWVNARYVSTTNLQLVPVTDPNTRPTPPPPTPVPGSAFATVTTYFLNVRQTPDPVNGVILARISRGQTYPVIGRNPDTSWLLLNVNGTVGWVNARYVVTSDLSGVPVISGNTQPAPVIATVTTDQLNVRAVPDPVNGLIIARIRLGETYPVIGRNAAGTWAQLQVGALIGWVNARYLSVVGLAGLPITG